MNKGEKVTAIVLLIFLILISIFLLQVKRGTNEDQSNIEAKDIQIKNKDDLQLSDDEKEICIDKLIKYLNKKSYYECSEIEFYNNTFDEATNSQYFYALAIGNDQSLIEITNLGNGKFKYEYIGNELTPNDQSTTTGVSYLQIVNPEKYVKQKELEEIREKAKQDLPDDTEMP